MGSVRTIWGDGVFCERLSWRELDVLDCDIWMFLFNGSIDFNGFGVGNDD